MPRFRAGFHMPTQSKQIPFYEHASPWVNTHLDLLRPLFFCLGGDGDSSSLDDDEDEDDGEGGGFSLRFLEEDDLLDPCLFFGRLSTMEERIGEDKTSDCEKHFLKNMSESSACLWKVCSSHRSAFLATRQRDKTPLCMPSRAYHDTATFCTRQH